MKKILILNGPNLNMLGIRDTQHYGSLTLLQINSKLTKLAKDKGVECIFFQSNHEGALIDCIQKNTQHVAGILINPGALTHYGYSLADALTDSKLPIVEVHMSDINTREEFRKIDVLNGIVLEKIIGLKENSYLIGLKKLIKHIQQNIKQDDLNHFTD